MLLNFDHSADIPTKLTSFYRQAFEALYQRHDAAKGAYRRGHYAGLPLDEYEKVFSAFCFDSFLDTKVEFTDAELLDYFRAAATYYGVSAKAELLVEDARKSVCVIQREGLDNVFAHRTFQEYFTALFLSRYREEDFVQQVQDTSYNWHNNNVLKMLIEIAPEPVEQDWLEPLLKKTAGALRRAKPNTLSGAKAIFKAFYSSLEVNVETGHIVGFSGGGDQQGTRLSMIGLAYSPPVLMTRAIFKGSPIFESLRGYLEAQNQANSPDGILERIENFADDEDGPTQTIEVTPDDLPWLMASDLPSRLDDVRVEFLSFYDAMVNRIAKRSTAMERLRTRHAGASPIRRRKAS